MLRSERIEELAKALIAFQSQIVGIKRTSENHFFQSRYADLAECWETIREPLTKNGLCLSQSPDVSESGETVLETMLIHSSGEFIAGKLTMRPEKPTPQALGSCITYARRYGLMAILGLAPVDDDGNDASKKQEAWDGKYWKTCPIHFGQHPGTPLGAMDEVGIKWLLETWNPGSSDDDMQLSRALRKMSEEMGETNEYLTAEEQPT